MILLTLLAHFTVEAKVKKDVYKRQVSGLLTQYGFLTYDILFERVQKIAKIAEFDFKKFMGILINASCWQENILISEAGMIHYGVLDEDALEYEREKNANLTYKEFSYDETFKAGAVDYVSENNAYQQLIALMQVNFELDFKEANDIADELCIMLQNGDDMNEMLSYFQVALKVPTKLVTEELLKVFVEMKNTIGLWRLKGYSIKELGTVPLDCVENYRIVETKADGMRFVPAKASVCLLYTSEKSEKDDEFDAISMLTPTMDESYINLASIALNPCLLYTSRCV